MSDETKTAAPGKEPMPPTPTTVEDFTRQHPNWTRVCAMCHGDLPSLTDAMVAEVNMFAAHVAQHVTPVGGCVHCRRAPSGAPPPETPPPRCGAGLHCEDGLFVCHLAAGHAEFHKCWGDEGVHTWRAASPTTSALPPEETPIYGEAQPHWPVQSKPVWHGNTSPPVVCAAPLDSERLVTSLLEAAEEFARQVKEDKPRFAVANREIEADLRSLAARLPSLLTAEKELWELKHLAATAPNVEATLRAGLLRAEARVAELKVELRETKASTDALAYDRIAQLEKDLAESAALIERHALPSARVLREENDSLLLWRSSLLDQVRALTIFFADAPKTDERAWISRDAVLDILDPPKI